MLGKYNLPVCLVVWPWNYFVSSNWQLRCACLTAFFTQNGEVDTQAACGATTVQGFMWAYTEKNVWCSSFCSWPLFLWRCALMVYHSSTLLSSVWRTSDVHNWLLFQCYSLSFSFLKELTLEGKVRVYMLHWGTPTVFPKHLKYHVFGTSVYSLVLCWKHWS